MSFFTCLKNLKKQKNKYRPLAIACACLSLTACATELEVAELNIPKTDIKYGPHLVATETLKQSLSTAAARNPSNTPELDGRIKALKARAAKAQ